MRSPQTLVSVVLPTFNRAHTINEAIQSIQAQTHSNWELIIIDDGSTDNTSEIVQLIDDNRIKYYKTTNGGASRARNVGMQKSSGDWILYVDSDDAIYDFAIETMLEALHERPDAMFALSRSKRVLELYEEGTLVKSQDDTNDMSDEFTIQDIFDRNAGFSSTGIMHRRSTFTKGGVVWDEGLPMMEDWDFLLCLGEAYPDGFVYVPTILQTYVQRYGSNNIVSGTEYGKLADAFEYIFKKHANDESMKKSKLVS